MNLLSVESSATILGLRIYRCLIKMERTLSRHKSVSDQLLEEQVHSFFIRISRLKFAKF